MLKTLAFLFIFGLAGTAHAQCVDPVFTNLTPGSGPIAGGGQFKITGSNFCPGVTVDFGTASATLTAVTATQITGIVPSQAPGIVTLVITNPGLPSITVQNAFTYVNATGALVGSAGSPKFASVGQQIVFYGYATGGTPPYSFWWNFGDGTTGGTINGTKTYAASGRYEVTFFVTDRAGAMAFSTTTAFVTAPVTNFLLDDKGNILTDAQGKPLTAN